jgi:enamine deaminase RidA (YjgF/YER057c/UK114 family)
MYIPVKQLGKALYVSGQIPFVNGQLAYTGKVGKERTLQEAEDAARICALNILAAVRDYLGDLDKVANVVKIQAFVSSEVGFMQQHIVVNAASQLLYDIFGEAGRHARSAVGTNQLPLDATVEIEAIFEIA